MLECLNVSAHTYMYMFMEKKQSGYRPNRSTDLPDKSYLGKYIKDIFLKDFRCFGNILTHSCG